MSVTMRHVAQRAGVSINTVSRVVNGYGEVSDATRQRVLAAVNELGFRPNALARGLVSGKSLSVGMIVPEIIDPFFPDVVLGAESIARQHGYSLLLCNTNDDPQQELEYIGILAAKQIDGIILCGSRLDAEDLSLVSARYPVAILTSRKPRSAAVINLRAGSGLYESTSHLIRLGHRSIGHVGVRYPLGAERVEGYRQALLEHGLPFDEERVILTPRATIDMGASAAQALLEQRPAVTAVSCFNDLSAIGVLHACTRLGLRVPDDLAVVGFDDIDLASLVTPTLTTMHIPRFRLGEMVMELMLRVIAANGKHEELLYVDPRLIVRQSCGGLARMMPAVQEGREEVEAA